MGQFLFGLAAGVVVGLVMEWVIDWTGLLPGKSSGNKRGEQFIKSSVTPDDHPLDAVSKAATSRHFESDTGGE